MDKQIQTSRQTLLKMIDMNTKSAQQLIEQYGTGVRPSWVSAEVSEYWEKVSRLQAELAELDALEDDGFTTIVPEVK